MEKTYSRALTVASSDSGGAAGVQADLKAFSALGAYGMSVIVALTAQNTERVLDIHAAPPQFISNQFKAIFEDIGCDAVKVGMLFSREIIEVVCDAFEYYKPPNIVVDPVMVSTAGDLLLEPDAITSYKERLIPLATLVTPNLPEAETLVNRTIETVEDMQSVAPALGELGAPVVLLKGGRLKGQAELVDLLIENGQVTLELRKLCIDTKNTHGTGCTLSSSVAAFLARGFTLRDAVKEAHDYVHEAIKAGANYRLGSGHGPVQHFYQSWDGLHVQPREAGGIYSDVHNSIANYEHHYRGPCQVRGRDK